MSSAFNKYPLGAFFFFHFCVRSDKDVLKIQHLNLRRTLLSAPEQPRLGGISRLWREKDVPRQFRWKVKAWATPWFSQHFNLKKEAKWSSLSSSTQVTTCCFLTTAINDHIHLEGLIFNLCTILILLFDFVTSSSAHRFIYATSGIWTDLS